MAAESNARVEAAYRIAREQFAEVGVNTGKALLTLKTIPISIHCWQGDDVGGFEHGGGLQGGGILATGNYPGKARTADELRQDLDKVFSLVPSKHRVSLHASYAETGGGVDRTELEPKHFANWIEWARSRKIGLDFNQTFFSHPKAAGGVTLSSYDEKIRRFWIDHAKVCRRLGAYFGRQLGTPCITNLWIPDGSKDTPIDRKTPREILRAALDEVFAEPFPATELKDSVEAKLFGIGSESCVYGSHEFYLGYAISRKKMLTLDTGHFHPTEVVSDKLSAVLCFLDEVLLHVSRGVRWDSDHVVILTDELRAIAEEMVRNQYLGRVHLGLDFFDASINRVAAWTIGTRCTIKALLLALLEPTDLLRERELHGDCTARLAMLEELRTLPFGAVWDYYCQEMGVPVGATWFADVRKYEENVLSKRV